MSRFEIGKTPIADLHTIYRKRVGDSRGFLVRLFCSTGLSEAGWDVPISQINHTFTARCGTVRGMHYQCAPHAETKLVTCLRGKVFDVGVDLRSGSSTFLRWHGEELSAENGRALLIPRGFAHGFQALSDDVELLYCHSAAYVAEAEAGLNPRDPALGILWPLPVVELSNRDANHRFVGADFKGLSL